VVHLSRVAPTLFFPAFFRPCPGRCPRSAEYPVQILMSESFSFHRYSKSVVSGHMGHPCLFVAPNPSFWISPSIRKFSGAFHPFEVPNYASRSLDPWHVSPLVCFLTFEKFPPGVSLALPIVSYFLPMCSVSFRQFHNFCLYLQSYSFLYPLDSVNKRP